MTSRILVLASAIAMPVVAVLSERGVFGPDPGTIARESPTLLAAAGYAFSIWGVIFALAVAFAFWQNTRRRRHDPVLKIMRPALVVGYLATAAWMIIFAQRWYWLALAVIGIALVAMLSAMLRCVGGRPAVPLNSRFGAQELLRMIAPSAARHWLPRWALSLHAGWLSLAAFLNAAQVIVAERLLVDLPMLPWSLLLWLGAGMLLLAVDHRVAGEPGYVLAALWGLLAVVVEQTTHPMPGSVVSAAVAVALAVMLLWQAVRWWRRRTAGPPATA